MKLNSQIWVLGLALILGGTGCAAQAVTKQLPAPEIAPNPHGGRAKIAIADFQWKVGGGGGSGVHVSGPNGESWSYSVTTQESGYMSGLQDMMSTGLVQSQYFRVLERDQIGKVINEIDFGESDYVERKSAPKKGKIKGADLLIVAAVTGWEPDASGRSIGGGGLLKGVLGGIRVGKKKSSLSIDVRIVDSETSEVIAAKAIETEATSTSLGVGGLAFGGGGGLIGGLSSYENTPMEKAIRLAINEAVVYVAGNVPREYFVY